MSGTAARLTSRSSTLFSVLIGLSSVAILLQALWAGIFLSYQDRPQKWITVHARGGEVAIALTALALIAAVIQLRARKDLLIGTAALLVLLIVEAYLGGRIADDGQAKLTAVHVPLGMAIFGIAVWLPLRIRARAA